MTEIVITKDVVRRLSAAMSCSDPSALKHTDRIAMIAEAFGWRPDAFMHALKGGPEDKSAPKSSPDDIRLEQLGIGELALWKKVLSHESGVCFAFGATGSGKSTTLVASANHLREQGRAIFHRDHVTCQVSKRGDVMVFGAVRDRDDAHEAFWRAEQGFLVLATSARMTPGAAMETLAQSGITEAGMDRIVGGIAQTLLFRRCHDCPGSGCASCGGRGLRKRGRVLASTVVEFPTPRARRDYPRQVCRTDIHYAADLARLLSEGVLEERDILDHYDEDGLASVRGHKGTGA